MDGDYHVAIYTIIQPDIYLCNNLKSREIVKAHFLDVASKRMRELYYNQISRWLDVSTKKLRSLSDVYTTHHRQRARPLMASIIWVINLEVLLSLQQIMPHGNPVKLP